jgi:hypothetical protein
LFQGVVVYDCTRNNELLPHSKQIFFEKEFWSQRIGLSIMQALASGTFKSHTRKKNKGLRISESASGFSIVEGSKATGDPAYVAEIGFKLAGILIIPAGGIVMLLPQMVAGPAGLVTHTGMLAAFVFIGVALHRWADKGFTRKIQVNVPRQEVVVGTLNIEGDFHKKMTFPADAIESFFIVRSRDGYSKAKLQMRLKMGAETVGILEGAEKSLIPILERIALGLRPPQQSNRRIQTKTNGQFIRVSFG